MAALKAEICYEADATNARLAVPRNDWECVRACVVAFKTPRMERCNGKKEKRRKKDAKAASSSDRKRRKLTPPEAESSPVSINCAVDELESIGVHRELVN